MSQLPYELAAAIIRKRKIRKFDHEVVMSYVYYIRNDICLTIDDTIKRNGLYMLEELYAYRSKLFDIAKEAVELSKTEQNEYRKI